MLALHRFRQSQHTLQRNIHLRPCQERHRNSYNRNSFNLCKRFVWPPSRQSAGTTGLNDELDSKSVLAFPRSQRERERERAKQTGRERASRHPFSPPLTSRTSSSDDIFKRIRDLEESLLRLPTKIHFGQISFALSVAHADGQMFTSLLGQSKIES